MKTLQSHTNRWRCRPCVAALLLTLGVAFVSPAVLAQAQSAEEAVQIAKARHGGGKVLGVRRKSRDGRTYYEVKILTKGQVSIYKIDAD